MGNGFNLRGLILQAVAAAEFRVAPLALEQQVVAAIGNAGVTRQEVRRELKALVKAGELAYTYEFGVSFIENSFAKPVNIGESVVLIPAGVNQVFGADQIAIRLAPGASFGCGRHPTTRLGILGIEFALKTIPRFSGVRRQMLDIGVGSGILALTALALGIDTAVGLDIDPCSRYESGENAKLNHLENRFTFIDQELHEIADEFDLITANLRYPTLIRLAPEIQRLTKPRGLVVLSGIHVEESPRILEAWSDHGFSPCWRADEKNWSGIVMEKTAPLKVNALTER